MEFLEVEIMKYRSRHDIVAKILETTTETATKTDIMYSVHLSFAQTNSYLAKLLDEDLLKFDERTRYYKISKKGTEFLETYYRLQKLFPVEIEGRDLTRTELN